MQHYQDKFRKAHLKHKHTVYLFLVELGCDEKYVLAFLRTTHFKYDPFLWKRPATFLRKRKRPRDPKKLARIVTKRLAAWGKLQVEEMNYLQTFYEEMGEITPGQYATLNIFDYPRHTLLERFPTSPDSDSPAVLPNT